MIGPALVTNSLDIGNLSPITSQRVDSPTKIQRAAHDCNSTNRFAGSDSSSSNSNSQKIREALAGEFPELETLYSDAYLESVAGAPGRSLSYATEHTIRRSLEWRRSYGVEALRRAFEVVVDGKDISKSNDNDSGNIRGEKSETIVRGRHFVPCHDSKKKKNSKFDTKNANQSSLSGFVPSRELVKVCSSGAFVVLDEKLVSTKTGRNSNRKQKSCRLVLYADTSRLNWWKTGITAGLQYHVLVLEDALEQIRNNRCNGNTGSCHELEESIVLFVDTTATPLLPPPLGVLQGMTQLLQKAYPDRIHKIFVGPVSPWIRALYESVRPFLKPRSSDKIVLLGEVPSVEALARFESNRRKPNKL